MMNRIHSALLLSCFAVLPALSLGCSQGIEETEGSSEAVTVQPAPIAPLLAGIPEGTTWAQLSPSIRAQLEANARATFDKNRKEWGEEGLNAKSLAFGTHPTKEMLATFDEVMTTRFANVIPKGFVPSTGITHPELKKQLVRLYLLDQAKAASVGSSDGFKAWDGSEPLGYAILDEDAIGEQKEVAKDVERSLQAIKSDTLSKTEAAIREKAFFFARQFKRASLGWNWGGDDMLQAGVISDWSSLFLMQDGADPRLPDAESYLSALNAFTFIKLRYANVGTVDRFASTLEENTDVEMMKGMGFDPATVPLAKSFLTLTGWWKERVLASKKASDACTIYSPVERAQIWDAFTADNMANADGSQTMEAYAASYKSVAASRLAQTKSIAKEALEATFPASSKLLSAADKAKVLAAIDSETAPAAVLETTYRALDQVNPKGDARKALAADFDALVTIGGTYDDGSALKAEEAKLVQSMWAAVTAYVRKHYAGYTVDIGALLPAKIDVTTDYGSYTDSLSGVVSIGLGKSWNKASLYSTMLHEAKHSIDILSKAPVEGAAWEGGGKAVEDLVWPDFIKEAMATDAKLLPHYRLGTNIDNVRFTATTDATLGIYLRTSCSAGQPNSLEFAKSIVRGYGYTDEDTLTARSRRAHNGTQYLSYDYGAVIVEDQITWLKANVAAATSVDPYLLQACAIPNTDKTPAVQAKLATCLAAHK